MVVHKTNQVRRLISRQAPARREAKATKADRLVHQRVRPRQRRPLSLPAPNRRQMGRNLAAQQMAPQLNQPTHQLLLR